MATGEMDGKKKLNFVSSKWAIVILVIVYLTGLVAFSFEEQIPQQLDEDIHLLFGFIGLILVLRSFVERDNAIRAWALIIFSQFFNVLSIALLNDKYEYQEILLYISGLLISAVIGLICLFKLKAKERKIDLQSFYGNVYEYPKLKFCFSYVLFRFCEFTVYAFFYWD
jgi:NADH-quinone oxidoreductase subunit L